MPMPFSTSAIGLGTVWRTARSSAGRNSSSEVLPGTGMWRTEPPAMMKP